MSGEKAEYAVALTLVGEDEPFARTLVDVLEY